MEALIGGGIAAVLTVSILSRAFADNPLYRLAQQLFVGLALGLAGAIIVRNALLVPVQRLANGSPAANELGILIAGLVLVALLAARFGHQRLSLLANYPLALLFGVGGALALIGTMRGTVVPQVLATIHVPSLLSGDGATQAGLVVMVVTTMITLWSFMYSTSAQGPTLRHRLRVGLGRSLILAAFGVLFAAAVTTYVAALVGQLTALIDWINRVLGAV